MVYGTGTKSLIIILLIYTIESQSHGPEQGSIIRCKTTGV